MPTFRARGLSLRLVLPTAVLAALLMTSFVVLQLRQASTRATESLDAYADLLGGVVLDNLRVAMLLDERERLEEQLDRLASSRFVRRIDVVNAQGVVSLSSDHDATGEELARTDAVCAVCHDQRGALPTTGRSVPVTADGGVTTYRFVQPIMPEPECFECHKEAEPGVHLGILVTDLDDVALVTRQLDGARELSWTLAGALAVLLVSLAVIIRFVVVARLRKVRRLLEFVRAGTQGSPSQPRSPDEIDEIERLVYTVAEDVEDRRALGRATDLLHGVLERCHEPAALLDPTGRVLATNSALARRPDHAKAIRRGETLPMDAGDGDALAQARAHGWTLRDAEDAPLVASLSDSTAPALAFAKVWRGAEPDSAGGDSLSAPAEVDPEWQLYASATLSAIASEPARWQGVAQLDRRFTAARRLVTELAAASNQLAAERGPVDLRSMLLLVLWDIGRQVPDLTWHSALDARHVVHGQRHQLRALARRLAEAAAAQARPRSHAVLFTQSSADGAKLYLGAWARSDEEPIAVDGARGLPLAELLARNHGGGVEVNRAFDIGPLCAARGVALPCNSRGVLFVAELRADGGRPTSRKPLRRVT